MYAIRSYYGNQSTYNQSNNLATLYAKATYGYLYTEQMLADWIEETSLTGVNDAVRTLYGGYVTDVDGANYDKASVGYIWKYCGIGFQEQVRASGSEQDPNFIVYRVADVMLMKAEALISMSSSSDSWGAALDLVNEIRTRSKLPVLTPALEELSEGDMLEMVLHERNMELAAEGKRWYDLLRLGKRDDYKYRNQFLINKVIEYNNTANPAWILV